MKKYVVKFINNDSFTVLITLLDYETKITRNLKSIFLSSLAGSRILVDTALCSGINNYRFIATNFMEDGFVNIGKYEYVNVNPELMAIANKELKRHQASLNNSVLTKSQIDKLSV